MSKYKSGDASARIERDLRIVEAVAADAIARVMDAIEQVQGDGKGGVVMKLDELVGRMVAAKNEVISPMAVAVTTLRTEEQAETGAVDEGVSA